MRYYVLSITKDCCSVLESSCDFRKSLRFLNTRLLHQQETLELVSDGLVKYLLDDVKINFDWSDCKAD